MASRPLGPDATSAGLRSRRRRSNSSPPKRTSRRAADAARTMPDRASVPTRGSRPELFADGGRPLGSNEAMSLEERHHDALHPEAEARRLGDQAVLGMDVEDFSEVLLVIVE